MEIEVSPPRTDEMIRDKLHTVRESIRGYLVDNASVTLVSCGYSNSFFKDNLFTASFNVGGMHVDGITIMDYEILDPHHGQVSTYNRIVTYLHQYLQCLDTAKEERLRLFLLLRPSFDTLWYRLGYKPGELTPSNYDRINDFIRMVASIVDDDWQKRLAIEKNGPLINELLITLRKPDIEHFRVLDSANDSLLAYKDNYRQLLLCYYNEKRGPQLEWWRKQYYLSYGESHYRNLLFRFFREEIMLRFTLFHTHLICDVVHGMMMDYVMHIIM